MYVAAIAGTTVTTWTNSVTQNLIRGSGLTAVAYTQTGTFTVQANTPFALSDLGDQLILSTTADFFKIEAFCDLAGSQYSQTTKAC